MTETNVVEEKTGVVLRSEKETSTFGLENAGYQTEGCTYVCKTAPHSSFINESIAKKKTNTFVFMPGVYEITAPINCFPGMRLVGSSQGKGGVLEADNSQVVFKVGAGFRGAVFNLNKQPDVTIENIVIDLDGQASLKAVLTDKESPGLTIRNCRVQNIGANAEGFRLLSEANVEGCTFEGGSTAIAVGSVGVVAMDNMAMANSKFANLAYGVKTGAVTGVAGYMKENKMDHCTVGVQLNGEGYCVEHCTMNACDSGVYLGSAAKYNVITNNTIHNPAVNSIYLQKGASNNFVQNNAGLNLKSVTDESSKDTNIIINRQSITVMGNFFKKASELKSSWDEGITSGFYMGYNKINAPVPAQWFMGIAMRHNDQRVVQRVYSFVNGHKWYERYSVPNEVENQPPVWSEWVEDVSISRADKNALDAHLADASKHVTTAEKTAWDAKAAAIHSHSQEEVSGLAEALADKADAGHIHDDRYYTETELDSKLASKAATRHGHAQGDITGLATALAGKAEKNHWHTAEDTGAVPSYRRINGKELFEDITLSAADINALSASAKGAANGVASLDAKGLIPVRQLPTSIGEMGEFYKKASIISDWNTVLNSGFYMAGDAMHAPVDGRWYIGYVMRHNNDRMVQRVYSFTTDHKWYQRYSYKGPMMNQPEWSQWQEDVSLSREDKDAIDAHLADVAKHLTEGERTAWNSKPDAACITIPAGRIMGDIDGDGIAGSKADIALLQDGAYYDTVFSNKFPDGNVPLDYQAADLNKDGRIDVDDLILMNANTFDKTDLLGNWTLAANNASGEANAYPYYIDIPVAGMTEAKSAYLLIQPGSEGVTGLCGLGRQAICQDGAVRLVAKQCPIAPLQAHVLYYDGNGSATVVDVGLTDTRLAALEARLTALENQG